MTRVFLTVVTILIIGMLLVVLAVQRNAHKTEMLTLTDTMAGQEEELKLLRSDNAYLASQITEIDMLERELESKTRELEIMRDREAEFQEQLNTLKEESYDFDELEKEVNTLHGENVQLKKRIEELEANTAVLPLAEEAPLTFTDEAPEESAADPAPIEPENEILFQR